MWQPVTNHEEAWEYLLEKQLWYGAPERDFIERYEDGFANTEHRDKAWFLKMCAAQGTCDGFTHPHYILVEE